MQLNPIAVAVPIFFVSIGVEAVIAYRLKRHVYRFADAITDLSCGITNQLVALLIGASLLAGYAYLYDHFRLLTLPVWSQWLLALIGVDFLYYWWHRLSHEVNFLWAAHVVHHSSEDYNLAVALRQSAFTPFTQWAFYLPLAFLGVPVLVFATMTALSTLYQFWIHTELVGELPRADRLINTPSVHRVHHAINPKYLDKNYAAAFMIWDRLFGTFEPEVEKPVYGISVPLHSFSPAWAQVHYYAELFKSCARAPNLFQGLSVFFRSPAWQAPWLPKKESCFQPGGIEKYNPKPSRRLIRYVFLQFAVIAAVMFIALNFEHALPRAAIYAICAFVFLTVVAWGGLFENRRWAVPLELGRNAVLLSAIGALAYLYVR